MQSVSASKLHGSDTTCVIELYARLSFRLSCWLHIMDSISSYKFLSPPRSLTRGNVDALCTHGRKLIDIHLLQQCQIQQPNRQSSSNHRGHAHTNLSGAIHIDIFRGIFFTSWSDGIKVDDILLHEHGIRCGRVWTVHGRNVHVFGRHGGVCDC